jgi:hypothetical protein
LLSQVKFFALELLKRRPPLSFTVVGGIDARSLSNVQPQLSQSRVASFPPDVRDLSFCNTSGAFGAPTCAPDASPGLHIGRRRSDDAVTAVVTSCGRHDLLQRTLDSFFAHNSFEVDQTVVVEDGPDVPEPVRERYVGRKILWLATGERGGQIAAIDHAYAHVATPYIFHLEDDWEFYRSGFIEKSLVVLRSDTKCSQVWLRALSNIQQHPVEPRIFRSDGVEWRRVALEHIIQGYHWHGFSFNPGLRRTSDYTAIGCYSKHVRFDFQVPWLAENVIGKLYRSLGFHAVILCDREGAGYVRHIGYGRRVVPPAAPGSEPRP